MLIKLANMASNDVDMDRETVPWYKNVNTKRRRLNDAVSVTPLANRFAPLAKLPDTNLATQSDNVPDKQPNDDAADKQESEVRPPAFFINDCVDSVEAMLSTFTKLAGNDSFSYRCVKDNIKINAKSIETYKKLTKFCKEKEIHYYTHQIKTDRAFRVVLKGLHHSYPTQSLTEEIQAKGHSVRRINKMWNKRSSEPYNMFAIELEPAQNNKDIYSIKYIDHCVVSIEAPHKRREEIQCHKCQDYGHSKNYCERRPRCVKCAGDHFTSECKQNMNVPPKCVHCDQQHTANYKGCPHYKLITQANSTRKMPPPPPRPSFQMDQLQFPHLNRQVPVSNDNSNYYNKPQGAWSLDQRMTRLENLMEKQIEMTNNLLATISNLINSLCHK